MRVIGGHDYFDSAMAYGVDQTIVFNRAKFETNEKMVPTINTPLIDKELNVYYVNQYIHRLTYIDIHNFDRITKKDISLNSKFKEIVVWFAGKRYAGILDYKSNNIYWNYEEFKKANYNEFFNDSTLAIISKKTLLHIKNFMERKETTAEVEWLIENKVSIAILGVDHTTALKKEKNIWRIDTDGLKELKFAANLDPFTAYQELYQWVSGVLPRTEKPMISISDEKIILQKHGMDKWSFKKKPN